MEEQDGTQSYQKSDSYPSPRSHSSPSLQNIHPISPEEGQEEEQQPQELHELQKSTPYTNSTEVSSSASLDKSPLPKAIDSQTHQQNGIQVQTQPEIEHQASLQISGDQQQQTSQPSVVASPPTVLAATQPTTNPQLSHSVLSLNAFFPHSGSHSGSQMTINQSTQATALRYSLTPHRNDERIMTGSRNRKEVKRRTKTGCLTCRKRRIKCDEVHPVCRNCQKSKRECLGYDPIFKQQPGPPQIQPAPSVATPTSASPNTTVTSSAYSNVPQGYSSTNPNSSYPPDPSIGSTFAIVEPSSSAITQPVSSISQPLRTDMSQTMTGVNGHRPPSIPDNQVVKAKAVSIDDLLCVEEASTPQPSDTTIEPSAMNEVKLLFIKDYAPGLDKFLETSWYTTNGLAHLLNQPKACEMFANLIKQFRTINSNDYDGMRRIASMEAKLVWNLACLPRLSSLPTTTATNGSKGPEATIDQLSNVKRRLSTLESLLTNDVLDINLLPEISEVTSTPPANFYEIEFWRNLGLFAATSETSPNSSEKIENALNSMRNVLGQLENRDVLYSIAVARYYGLRVAEFPGSLQQAFSADDSDKYTKLFIAKHFIEQEANGKGTTQVIQRFCGMAVRSWPAIRV